MHEYHDEADDFFCRFTFGQFVSLALLEIVALFFAFYLGSRYGPSLWGTPEETHLDDLAALEEPAAVLPPSETEVRYTFPEELTRKPARIEVEPSPKPKKTPSPEPVQAVRSVPSRSDQQAQAPVAQPEPVSPAQPVTGGRGGYSIQVGSYRQASGAAQKVNLWQSRGYDAFLSIGEVAGSGTWYRVRIGNFASRDNARQFLNQLNQRESVKGIIVKSSS